MRVVSSADLFVTLAEGQRVGQLRRSLLRLSNEQSSAITAELQAREDDIRAGLTETGAARRSAWGAVLDSTSALASAHDLLGQLGSLDRRGAEMLGDVAAAAELLVELAGLELPDALVPEPLRDQLAAIRAGDADAERMARSLLGLGLPFGATSFVGLLRSVTHLRFTALHATLLGGIADATPDAGAATDGELASLTSDVAARVRAVRDAALSAAEDLRAGSATPAFALALWAALFEFEQWLVAAAAGRLAAVAAAATARVASGAPDGERWAREMGQAYDELRVGLALDAGVRAVLLAHATHETRALSAFAETAGLPVGTATVDLPRAGLADVATAAEGEAIEIAGLVSDAEFRVGGPSNRSVLTLGAAGSVRVLVPHVAADSFGIATGVWVQVRGEAHPTGKDGIDGPVVMVGRIRRQAAAAESFTDALIFAGRDSFELRPGGLDIVAGRVAGDLVTFSEIGRR